MENAIENTMQNTMELTIAIATSVVAAATVIYAAVLYCQSKHLRTQAEQMERQTKLLMQQDQEARDRGVEAICLEFFWNERRLQDEPRVSIPLHEGAHDAYSWALTAKGATVETQRVTSKAALCVQHHNSVFRRDPGKGSSPAYLSRSRDLGKTWEQLEKLLPAAVAALRSDPATAEYIPPDEQ